MAGFDEILLIGATILPSFVLDALYAGLHPWFAVWQAATLILGMGFFHLYTRRVRWWLRAICMLFGYLCLNFGFTIVANYFLYGTYRDVWWHPLLVVILLSVFESGMIGLARLTIKE